LVAEEFQMDDVGIAADGTILDVFLFGPAGGIERDYDLLAAGGADVGAFIAGAAACFITLVDFV
jgi:hypothetical protein